MKIESQKKSMTGFTLIEVLLVLVIASMLIFMGLNYVQQKALVTRQDRTVLQIQQIMNAGLAYYVANGSWPTMVNLTAGGYLPTSIPTPWAGSNYSVAQSANKWLWHVWIPITSAAGSTTGSAMASANVIAGQLPLAYTTSTNGAPPPAAGSGGAACTAASTTCYVVASINMPGQNLNNATAMNFAGVYSHGGCVPVPSCPPTPTGAAMTPQIFVVPISVSGVNDTGSSTNVYPISSFTAYAKGGVDNTPPACTGNNFPTNPPCGSAANIPNGPPASNKYWRACVQIVTVKGDVRVTRTDRWGNLVKLGAFTRCAITNEPSGSHYLNVFSR